MNVSVIDFVLLLCTTDFIRLYSLKHNRPITSVMSVKSLLENDYMGYGANIVNKIIIGSYGI